ncbi:MAG: AHH domain-containing protein [Ketobacteraceae bacterium]|nr:AHH domain-containing protein [Ketobacteraceae bacterium]
MSKGIASKKSSTYRQTIIKAVGRDAGHPINQGIHMEAHHLVSSESVKLSKMSSILEHGGYDINLLNNLVLLPATLPGACHLEVQLHRGNHYGYANEQDNDSDDAHPINYHLEVAARLQLVEREIDDCNNDCKKSGIKVQDIVDEVSEDILDLISDFEIPLTPVHGAFRKGEKTGCGNCIDVNEHQEESAECASMRGHEGEEHPKFRNGQFPKTITRRNSEKRYRLRVGR